MLTLFLSFASRTVFIYTLGAVYLGLQGLFSNVLSFLALSELGIGSAISFLLYKPLAVNDVQRIKAIMHFYKRCYIVVGLIIIFLGCGLMPFLKYMVNLEQPIPENLYLIFILFVLNSAVSYFFVAYKQTLIEANQKKYQLTSLEISFTIINCVVDIIVLLAFKDFIVYLVIKLLLVVIRNLVLAHRIDVLYPFLKEPVEKHLAKSEIINIFKDIYSVFVFRLGTVLFNSVSNIVTSAVVGTIVVGYYSNYTLIVVNVEGIYMMAVTAVSAGIGNVVATENKEKQYQIYRKIDLLTFFFYGVCTIGLHQLLNSFIYIWLGERDQSYILSQIVVLLICANFYINCSAQTLERFRNANGLFSLGRDLQVLGGVVNIFLSVFLAKKWGIEGVLASPFICKILITTTPYIARVGKYCFGKSMVFMLKEFFSRMFVIFFLGSIIYYVCSTIHLGNIFMFIFEILITIVISILGLYFLYHRTDEFKELSYQYIKRFYRKK